MRRVDDDDLIYKTRREKYNAIIEEIAAMHEAGRPVLVGTVSVEVSETLSRLLKRRGINHSVLNAKYHQQEAEIVSRAGRPGAVTIATNMAGRGTDIKLGPGVVKGKECVLRCDLPLEECGATESKESCLDDMPAGCTSSAPSATRRAASTASCAAAPAVRAIPGPRASSSRSRTI